MASVSSGSDDHGKLGAAQGFLREAALQPFYNSRICHPLRFNPLITPFVETPFTIRATRGMLRF